MSEPSVAVQTAIYTALQGLSAADVYDAVPQGAAYPYVVIDSTLIMADDPLASRRDERIIYLSVWSQYRGQKEVLEIMAEIDALLHQQSLSLSTGRMVRSYVKDKITNRDADNLTFQGRVTLRVITEH